MLLRQFRGMGDFADDAESVEPKERLRNSATRRMSVGGRNAMRNSDRICPDGLVVEVREHQLLGFRVEPVGSREQWWGLLR